MCTSTKTVNQIVEVIYTLANFLYFLSQLLSVLLPSQTYSLPITQFFTIKHDNNLTKLKMNHT